jgi:PiT family inorganic phosphate transporter
LLLIVLIVVVALAFDFTNGFNDSANIVAAAIMSRAIGPSTALLLAAVSEFVGAYFLGTAVASTVGKGIIDPAGFTASGGAAGGLAILSALFGAIAWNVTSLRMGVPSSSSHALIGGLIGAFIALAGFHSVYWNKVAQVISIMIISPVIGIASTFIFAKLTLLFASWSSPRINKIFRKFQIVALVTQALAHGTNDAQKTMGVITFALIAMGFLAAPDAAAALVVPKWVTAACAAAIALGMGSGGRKIIKTLGGKLYKIRPVHGFASQTASSLIIAATSFFGYPISTSQVISSSVMGAGAAFRPKMVRWQVAKDMGMAWLVTIPVSALVSALIFSVVKKILL